VYDINCLCSGTFQDLDNDGVCDADDVCPAGDDNIDNDNNGIPDACEINEHSCTPMISLETDDSDVYIGSSCHGIILTSPNGNCFRLLVNDDGSMRTEAVNCP